jgi:Xaa-Pro dipeptidase
MGLHFTSQEFERRKARLLGAMAEAGLDGMLLFEQESMYWLTGYDTFGFCFFQCLVVAADGRMALLTRSADLRQAQHTSTLADIRIWRDAADADPARDLRALAAELGLAGRRLGVEYESYGLVASNGRRLDAAFEGFARLVDASRLVTRLRAVKSEEELAHVRRAGALSDKAARSWPPSTPRSFAPAATIRATSSSSAPAATRSCAATNPAGARSTPATRSPSNSPGPGGITTPPSCARS